MIIQLEDGRKLEVQDGSTPEQIDEVVSHVSSAQPAAPAPQQPTVGAARTALDQGLQGATFGFADEITDRIGAGIAAAATDQTYGDLLKEARGMTKEQLQAEFEQRPGLSIASNLAGGLITGGAGAATKTGATVGNFLRNGNTLAKIGKGIGAGAVSGSIYGAGSADDGERGKGAITGAATGAVLGGVLPAAGALAKSTAEGTKNTIKGWTARAPEELAAAGQKIKAESSKAYQAMKNYGAVFTPQTSNNIAVSLENKLKSDGPLNGELHKRTISVLDDIKNAASSPDFDLEKIDQWRRLLGRVASDNTPTNAEDARKATLLIDDLDDVVDSLKASDLASGDVKAIDSLNKGRQEYARARKFQSIADIVEKSDGDANYLKRELKKFADSKKKTRDFTKVELDALNDAKTLTAGEGIAKMLGKFGFDLGNSRIGSGVGAIVGAGTSGAFLGTGAGLAAPIVGTGARYVQKGLARGKAETLLQAIESGQSVPIKQVLALPPALARPILNLYYRGSKNLGQKLTSEGSKVK